MSVRASTGLLSACSGDMYATVPTIAPCSVKGGGVGSGRCTVNRPQPDVPDQLREAEVEHFDASLL